MRFEAWQEPDGLLLATSEGLKTYALAPGSTFLYAFEAATHEEAMAIHHLRQGFEPYKPLGPAVPCPNGCATHYYPEGGGVCPLCGV